MAAEALANGGVRHAQRQGPTQPTTWMHLSTLHRPPSTWAPHTQVAQYFQHFKAAAAQADVVLRGCGHVAGDVNVSLGVNGMHNASAQGVGHCAPQTTPFSSMVELSTKSGDMTEHTAKVE